MILLSWKEDLLQRVRELGAAKATELALIGDPLSATDAERFGLVAKVVRPEALMDEARGLAVRLADGAPRALGLTKRALSRAAASTLEEALEYEAWLQGIAGATADHAEGVAAFVEKRPARFTGK